jgi:hypothetical protein
MSVMTRHVVVGARGAIPALRAREVPAHEAEVQHQQASGKSGEAAHEHGRSLVGPGLGTVKKLASSGSTGHRARPCGYAFWMFLAPTSTTVAWTTSPRPSLEE